MSDEYTPEDWEIRRDWLLGGGTDAEFERWLAEHDRKVEARGLKKVAGNIHARRNDGVPDWAILDDLLFALSARQVREGN